MISTRLVELVIDTVVCLTLAKWETVSGQFGGYLTGMLTAEMLEAVCPNLHILKMPQATVYRLDADQCQKIESVWAKGP
jgi:hypothetical protein